MRWDHFCLFAAFYSFFATLKYYAYEIVVGKQRVRSGAIYESAKLMEGTKCLENVWQFHLITDATHTRFPFITVKKLKVKWNGLYGNTYEV